MICFFQFNHLLNNGFEVKIFATKYIIIYYKIKVFEDFK